MRIRRILAAACVLLASAASLAGDVFEGWHRKLEDAQTAARRSGRPIFLVTLWKDGV